MSLVVVDASVWVSRLIPGDVAHERASDWLDDQRRTGNGFLSPSLLLPEIGGAISRRTSAELGEAALQIMEDLPGLRLVEMDSALVSSAGKLAAQLGLRGADSLYVAVAHVLKLPLATLDKDQSERASALIEVLFL